MPLDLTELANTIKTLAFFLATITIAYAGFTLATSKDSQERDDWKEVVAGTFIGLVLLFAAPLLASQLSGGVYCKG